MRYRGMFNLAFGDLLPDGRIDDSVVSNNGDVIKVFSTIIRIVIDFLNNNPTAIIFFTSSSEVRIKLYNRILTKHHDDFKNIFAITRLIKNAGEIEEVSFSEKTNILAFAFLVRSK